MNKIELKLPKCKDFVSVARMTVSSYASNYDFPIGRIDDIKIVVSEACNNIVMHSKSCDEGTYFIEVFVENDYLTIEITDKDGEFDFSSYTEPDTNKINDGGFGIYIIKSLADDFEFLTTEDGQVVKIKFKV